MKAVQVVSAIIEDNAGLILIAERPPGKHLAGYWEFPGGKIENGESPMLALRRELKEELELDIHIEESLGCYPFNYPAGAIDLHVFRVSALNTPRATADVQNFKWVIPHALNLTTLAPADIAPYHFYLKRQTQP